MGGNLVNVLSGAAASYLGYKGAPAAQQRGAQFLGIANILVGVLNAAGVNQIAGFGLNSGNVATAISVIIGIWGLVAGFMKQKQKRPQSTGRPGATGVLVFGAH
jgi:hypothetical protein